MSDTHHGNDRDNYIVGGGGNDTIYGHGGDDSLYGDGGISGFLSPGDDYIDGGAGNDWIDGGNGNDTIEGGAGADTLNGGNGGLFSSGGEDWLSYAGSDGAVTVDLTAETVAGGHATGDRISNFEHVIGSDHDDVLRGGETADNILLGGKGDDTIYTAYGDIAEGGEGDDLLVGSNNATGESEDTLRGGDGDDTIIGHRGADSIDAGAGDDRVIWNNGDGNDTIDLGDGDDTLDLEGWNGTDEDPWDVSGPQDDDAYIFTNTTTNETLRVYGYDGNVVCYAEGTRIATARGEVPVEELRVGDLAVSAGIHGGPLQPVVWIGRTRARIKGHRRPERVAPVLIKAGALGKDVPLRDLRVSPDHSMFVDGHLVPAKHLVNGTTIVQEMWWPEISYYHVELPQHGLLMAEGAPSESYFDDGNRHLFDNAAVTRLFVDFEANRGNGLYARNACYPLLQEGPALEAIRDRLAERARRVFGLAPRPEYTLRVLLPRTARRR